MNGWVGWDAEAQRWDPAVEAEFRRIRAGIFERRLRVTSVMLAVLVAVVVGGARLAGSS